MYSLYDNLFNLCNIITCCAHGLSGRTGLQRRYLLPRAALAAVRATSGEAFEATCCQRFCSSSLHTMLQAVWTLSQHFRSSSEEGSPFTALFWQRRQKVLGASSKERKFYLLGSALSTSTFDCGTASTTGGTASGSRCR